jgi:hypothetical protein
MTKVYKLYALHAHDNEYKSTITAIVNYMFDMSNPETQKRHQHSDMLAIDYIIQEIELLKTKLNNNIYHFADAPKKMYGELSGDWSMSTPVNEDRLAKELCRASFVAWAESQKELFGSNVWAKRVVKTINNNKKTCFIGDLRFKSELDEIQKNINPNRKVEFMYVDVLNRKSNETYYIKDKMNNAWFHHKITVDASKPYTDILKDIYLQLIPIIT